VLTVRSAPTAPTSARASPQCRWGRLEFPAAERIYGVEAGINLHGGDSGGHFAARNRPLNGCGATIFRQERGVQIDIAERRRSSIHWRNDAAITDHNDCIGFQSIELSMKAGLFLMVSGWTMGTPDCTADCLMAKKPVQGRAPWVDLVASPQLDVKSSLDKFAERGHGEARRCRKKRG